MQFAITLLFAVLLTFTADHVLATPTRPMGMAARSFTSSKILSTTTLNGKIKVTTVQASSLLMKRSHSFKNESGVNVMDITPAVPQEQFCFPGIELAPDPQDCQVIIDAQLYASTGSLVANADTVVYVSYQTCAIVMQNIGRSNPQLQLNWAMLGNITRDLFNQCLTTDVEHNVGAARMYQSYLNVTLDQVYVTLQGFEHQQATHP
ncbi:hypothetical protein CROQUDRAFT_714966 [Cronartium quercuum f. sp. fusiforme G11]|uniref:Uncharacterized protein n=1 Tax=Cronartium quercuum f. sp. fusiforme G11 TaxID=708437 RepID=A0A9P6NKK7_9BASI|nr:hypothetical protein CROQUDRAFT_714966 [Cronartium quercuum f. sp. fusiforme G11]